MPWERVVPTSSSGYKKSLIKHRPKGKRGGDRRSESFKIDNVNFEKPKTGNSRLYIEERLQRDHPKKVAMIAITPHTKRRRRKNDTMPMLADHPKMRNQRKPFHRLKNLVHVMRSPRGLESVIERMKSTTYRKNDRRR